MIFSYTKSKTTKNFSGFYFLAAAVVVALVVDLADFFFGCLRCGRFFVSVFAVSPVKYEVTFCNNDESDQVDFFVSTGRATRLVTLPAEPSPPANLALRALSKFLRAT